jgi:hypothetical protein
VIKVLWLYQNLLIKLYLILKIKFKDIKRG